MSYLQFLHKALPVSTILAAARKGAIVTVWTEMTEVFYGERSYEEYQGHVMCSIVQGDQETSFDLFTIESEEEADEVCDLIAARLRAVRPRRRCRRQLPTPCEHCGCRIGHYVNERDDERLCLRCIEKLEQEYRDAGGRS